MTPQRIGLGDWVIVDEGSAYEGAIGVIIAIQPRISVSLFPGRIVNFPERYLRKIDDDQAVSVISLLKNMGRLKEQ